MEKEIIIKITGMHCNACASLIKMSLDEIGGVKDAQVDYPSAQAKVVFDDGKTDVEHLLGAVKEAGYDSTI